VARPGTSPASYIRDNPEAMISGQIFGAASRDREP
jgi:hypothetical protein